VQGEHGFAIIGRYFVAGSAAVGVHFLVLILLVELFAADPTLATTCGFAVGLVVNYLLQYHWTFRAEDAHSKRFPRYLAVTLLMMGVNALVFWGLEGPAGIPYLMAQGVATGVVFIFNFVINKHYTFAQ
jgi:putative flippase GtrA